MITFYHTADIHFGVENYGRIDPSTGIHTRLLDFKASLDSCIDSAIHEKIDFFLFSGDAYKTAYPTPTQQRLLMHALFRLQVANIPVIIIVGNHDHPLSFGKANALDVFSDLPLPGFHVFSKPGLLHLETKSGPVQIVGIPWPNRHNVIVKETHHLKEATEITCYLSTQITSIIHTFAGQLNPNIPAVLAAHLTVSNGTFSGSEKCAIYGSDPIFLASNLALPQFDYVALGHLHKHQNLNNNGYPSVVYSGSIDRIDFGERNETKGYCKVIIETNTPPQNKDKHQYTTKGSYEFIPLKTRPFIQIEAHISPKGNQTEQLLEEIAKYTLSDAIVKIIYHLPSNTKDFIDLRRIQRACKDALCLVNIIPIHQLQERRTRNFSLSVNMNFSDLVEKYIDSKNDLKDLKSSLMLKAERIYSETTSIKNSEQT